MQEPVEREFIMRIKALEPIFNFLIKAIEGFCKCMLCIMVVIVSISVLGRVLFNSPPSWGEEGGLFCLIWIATVSSSLAVVPNTHLRMAIAELIFPKRVLAWMDVAIDLLTLLFALFLVIQGIRYTQIGMLSVMAGLRIRKAWLYASVPVMGICIIIALLDVYLVRGGRRRREDEP